MEEFDDKLPQRTFDNFQFVNFETMFKRLRSTDFSSDCDAQIAESEFACCVVQEVSRQLEKLKSLGKLGEKPSKRAKLDYM